MSKTLGYSVMKNNKSYRITNKLWGTIFPGPQIRMGVQSIHLIQQKLCGSWTSFTFV